MKYLKFDLFLPVIFFILTLNIYSQQLPQADHVIIVIEENHSYNQIIDNNSAPYINSLANDTLGALFTNFYAETHPTQPNYLYIFSGSNQGVTSDNVPNDTPFATPNLGVALLQNNLTFDGFSEDLPSTAYQGASSGTYQRKHNPWVNWQNSNANGIPADLNMPFKDFPSDYDSLPKISFVIPNQNNDMHDGTVAEGDTWIEDNIDSYIQWAKTHNSLFVLTFDEDNDGSNNRIATIFVGQMVKHGQYGQHLNHLNLLRTFEDMYGLYHSGSSTDSTSISGCWINSTTQVKNIQGNVHEFELDQNYPNPFNPTTTIKYSIPHSENVQIKIYNVLGKLVKALLDENKVSGDYKIKFDGRNLASGLYYYRMTNGDYAETKKMILLKKIIISQVNSLFYGMKNSQMTNIHTYNQPHKKILWKNFPQNICVFK
jgi:acid phosphatase